MCDAAGTGSGLTRIGRVPFECELVVYHLRAWCCQSVYDDDSLRAPFRSYENKVGGKFNFSVNSITYTCRQFGTSFGMARFQVS